MPHWIKEHKVYVSLGLLTGIILVIYLIFSGKGLISQYTTEGENWERISPEFTNEEVNKETSTEETFKEDILVDVKGAVKNPGVYYARPGDRVIDVIDEAGGLIDGADETAVNFAMRVTDEMVIYIPKEGEEVELPDEVLAPGQKPEGGKVNLNKANQSELETLPGIGPSKAEAIIEYRENNGPFKAIEDLMLVSGFGEKTFAKLKDEITVK